MVILLIFHFALSVRSTAPNPVDWPINLQAAKTFETQAEAERKKKAVPRRREGLRRGTAEKRKDQEANSKLKPCVKGIAFGGHNGCARQSSAARQVNAIATARQTQPGERNPGCRASPTCPNLPDGRKLAAPFATVPHARSQSACDEHLTCDGPSTCNRHLTCGFALRARGEPKARPYVVNPAAYLAGRGRPAHPRRPPPGRASHTSRFTAPWPRSRRSCRRCDRS